MYTIRGFHKPPDIAEAAKILKVSVEDIDASFGVVSVDPDQGLYCVMADYSKVPSSFGETKPYEGPWATPDGDPIWFSEAFETRDQLKHI